MAGLVPTIMNCGTRLAVSLDARLKAGHDEQGAPESSEWI